MGVLTRPVGQDAQPTKFQLLEFSSLSLDEFLAHYGGDNRYELITAAVFDWEATVWPQEVAAFMATQILWPDQRSRATIG